MKYLLLIWLLAFSLAASACKKIKIAHAVLLKSTFTVQKNFVLNMDNEDKVKLNSVIEYHDGVLNRSQEEIIFIAEDFKYGEDESEPFLLSGFTCENIEIKGQQVVISMAVDDKIFTSFFLYQEDKLQPLQSIIAAEVSMLFIPKPFEDAGFTYALSLFS